MRIKVTVGIIVALILFVGGCSETPCFSELDGYTDYISDSGNGYNDIKYFNVKDSMEESEEARKYFNANQRRAGDYLITDYENGVCINQYFGSHNSGVIKIPEEIEGKPVVKIGGYIDNKSDGTFVGALGGYTDVVIELSSSVKVISKEVVFNENGMIPEESRYMFAYLSGFTVDEDNPYYSAENGNLFSKDYKKLLWMSTTYNSTDGSDGYIVPESVEVFEPANGVWCLLDKITFGKNVKEINTYIDNGESGTEPNPNIIPEVIVCGYKDSVAEEWAESQYAKFEEIN